MTHRTALILGFLLVCLFVADAIFAGGALLTYLGQSLIRVTEWLAFWR